MKIFFIIDSLVKGGTERRMLELVKALSAQKEFNIYLITLTDQVDFDYVYDLPIKFEIVKKKPKKDFSLYGKLYTRVKDFKPDIIHSWGTMASVLLAPIAKFLNIRFVNGYIGQAPINVTLKDEFYFRGLLTFPISDAIVSNSRAGLISYKAPMKKSHVIYNGIDFTRFENLKSPHLVKQDLFNETDTNSFVVGMVAAFEERKDYESFVKVAIKCCNADNNLKFITVGGGDKFEAIKAMVPASLLNTKILFLGKRSDVEAILQIFDIGILLTNSKVHGEGVSNSIIEYMASSKPVIATRGGGTDEIIENDINGCLVNDGAVDEIVSLINTLRLNKSKSAALGTAGYKLVHEKFDIQNMTYNYITLYKKLLQHQA